MTGSSLLAQLTPTDTATLPELGQTPGPIAEWAEDVTGSELVGTLVASMLEPLLESLVIVVLAWVASRLVRRGIDKMVEEMKDPSTHHRIGVLKKRVRIGDLQEGQRPHSPRREKRADALGALLRSVATGIVWTIALFMILGAFGVDLAPLIAGAGIVGIALGFGAQQLVQDFISGVFMLVEDQYGVGDIIDAGEASGVVEGVGLRSTRIRDVTGTLWHVPNGEIRRVGNMSQQWARALLDVGVAYGTDIDAASVVIKRVADEMAGEEAYRELFLDEPEVWGVENLGPDAVDIRLVIKTQPGEQYKIARELRARIKKAFDVEHIEIPFPQRTIWLKTDGSDDQPQDSEESR